MKEIGLTSRILITASTSLILFAMLTGEQPARAAVNRPISEIVVWDGTGAGWTNPETSTIQAESTDVHCSKSALEFKFHDGGQWLGSGWNWLGFKKGAYGADISHMHFLTFWAKTTGDTADLQLNLLCNGKVADMPEHHTDKIHLSTYCPKIGDGAWHLVTVPLTDLKQPPGFDAKHVCEIQFGFMADHPVAGSYIFDGIAFRR